MRLKTDLTIYEVIRHDLSRKPKELLADYIPRVHSIKKLIKEIVTDSSLIKLLASVKHSDAKGKLQLKQYINFKVKNKEISENLNYYITNLL